MPGPISCRRARSDHLGIWRGLKVAGCFSRPRQLMRLSDARANTAVAARISLYFPH